MEIRVSRKWRFLLDHADLELERAFDRGKSEHCTMVNEVMR